MSSSSSTGVHASLKDELEEKLCILQKEKADLERNFELKQVQFHELILQKDAELKEERENCMRWELKVKAMEEELSSMETEKAKIQSELNGVQTSMAVSETKKQEEIRNIISNYQEEVDSLQQLLKETAETASAKIAAQYESDKHKLVSLNESYEEEIQELRNKLRQEKVSFLSTVAKSIMRVGAIASINTSTEEHDNMEENMKKAHEEAQILKSVVVPLENEIQALKSKLAETESSLTEALKRNVSDQDASGSNSAHPSGRKSPSLPNLDSITDLSEKVEKLFNYLKTEKAARKDLEMYVTVLSTQKSMLQDETYKVNNELQEVCRLLEDEKQSHEALKQTWQMANDQFLESQRLMMADLRRMEGVLTTEQQRQITDVRRATNDVPVKIIYNGLDNNKSIPIRRQASMPEFSHVRKLQQKDETRKRQERKVQELDEKRNKQQRDQEERWRLKQAWMAKDKSVLRENSQEDTPPTSARAAHPASDSIPIMAGGLRNKRLSSSSRGTSNSPANSEAGDELCWKEFDDEATFLNNSPHESLLLEGSTTSAESMTVVRISPEKVLNLPSLTAAQIKAITDPTPETEANRSLVAGIKSKSDTNKLNLEGKRLVSEKEWVLLEDEIRASREKLGQSCVMCSNYEAQLQTAQEELKSVKTEVKQLEISLLSEQQISKNLLARQEELQLALKDAADDVQSQIIHLARGLQNCEKCVTNFRDHMSTTHQQLEDHCKILAEDREDVQRELAKLQEENDSLVDKYSKTAQQLQTENINLPDNVEELQLLARKYREQVIMAKVAKEHTEQTLKSEIAFFKALIIGEQQEKVTLEETMSQEITALQAKVAELEALRQELKSEAELRVQSDANLKKMESSFKNLQTKSKQFIEHMRERMEEMDERKAKLESENHSLKGKVQSLQGDVRNSEAVQRDFVKLSQSLQVQLEKIRQAENEVRWQYEDDIDDCNNCKLPFTVTRRKHHCRHCGRIFCADCTTKSVSSGRNFRPAKVCDVCHTILVNDATPYFHTEAPVT